MPTWSTSSNRDQRTAAGARRHRVTVQNPGAPVPDADGGYTSAWVDAMPASWYVAIDTLVPGTEPRAGAALQAEITHMVRGDYRPDVTPRTQLWFHGRRFYVRSVFDLEEARTELRCLVEEDVADRLTP